MTGELFVNIYSISGCENLYLLKEAGGAAAIARHQQPLSTLINEFLQEREREKGGDAKKRVATEWQMDVTAPYTP